MQTPQSRVPEKRDRIYLNPPRFWAATKNMSKEDVEEFAEKLVRLAEEHNFDELGRYDFILFGHKHRP
jgi:hypothetical protein